jgi:hypothetical protein
MPRLLDSKSGLILAGIISAHIGYRWFVEPIPFNTEDVTRFLEALFETVLTALSVPAYLRKRFRNISSSIVLMGIMASIKRMGEWI